MTDNKNQNDASKASEKTQPKAKSSPKNNPPKPASAKKSLLPLRPAILMGLAALIIAILSLIETFYLSSKIANIDRKDETTLTTLNAQMQNHDTVLRNLNQQLNELSDKVQTLNTQFSNNASTINELKNNTGQSAKLTWQLHEVTYLLKIAHSYLNLTPNPKTALVILEKANTTLATLNLPQALKLRQAITNIVTELQALPTIDKADILMKLNAISQELKALPLISPTATDFSQQDSPAQNTPSSTWKNYWHKTLSALEKLVVIRHHDKNVEPLISPKQQAFLNENIQLKLSEAGFALLQNDQALFQSSLKSAAKWISEYYVADSSATQSVLNTLTQIQQKVNLQPELPSLDKVLQLNEQLQAQSTKQGDKQ